MLRGLVLAAIALGADAACPEGDGAAPCPPIGRLCANALYGAGSKTCQTVGGLDVSFSKSGTTTKLTATYAGAIPTTGIWIAVGLGNPVLAMVGSAVAIGQLVGTTATFNGEYKLAVKDSTFQDTKLATTIKNPTIASANGNVVCSVDRWSLGSERHHTGLRWALQVFTFDADSGIAGTAFTDKDTVVAAWGTLDAAGTRLVYHTARGNSATPFTWSDGVAPTPATPVTEPPTTTTPTTTSPTTATPTATNTKAPTTAPPASLLNCSATDLERIAACRKSSLQTEAACKANSFSNPDANCRWCSNIGLTAGCYVVDVMIVCDTTDGISYLGNSCPTNVAQAVAGFLGLAMGVFIGIIGAHLSA